MTNKMDKIKITEDELKKIIKEGVITQLAKKLPKFFSKSTLKKVPKFVTGSSVKRSELPKFVTGSSVKRNEIPKFVTGTSITKRSELPKFVTSTSITKRSELPKFVYDINEENTDTKMAKIRITESELRQLIGNSVVSVLNEARYNTYGVNWDNLTDDQKQKYAEMYGSKVNAGRWVDANGNLSNAYTSGSTWQYDMNKMRDFYNQEQKKYAKNSRRNGITPELYQEVSKENGKLKSQLSQAQNLINGYKSAISQISSAISENSQVIGRQIAEAAGAPAPYDSSMAGVTTTAVTADQRAAMAVKSAVPNLDQILKSIKGMKTKVTQLTKANETLTSQNENLTSQNQNLTKRIQYGGQVTPIAGQSQVASTTPAPGLKIPGTEQV